MEEKDFIIIKNEVGEEEQVELILTANVNQKEYLLYKNNNGDVFASYLLENDDKLYNDLTEEELNMLDNLYMRGQDIYDKEN
jgi:hypothetical protein